MFWRNRKIYWSKWYVGCLPLIAAVAFGMFSLLMWVITITPYLEAVGEARASEQWASADGVISKAAATGLRLGKGNQVTDYRYSVQYKYVVNGQSYTGDRVHFSDRSDYFDSEQDALAALGGLKQGDAVTVYFDPADPSKSVLRREYKLPPLSSIVIGLATGSVAILLLFLTYWLLTIKPKNTTRTSRLPP